MTPTPPQLSTNFSPLLFLEGLLRRDIYFYRVFSKYSGWRFFSLVEAGLVTLMLHHISCYFNVVPTCVNLNGCLKSARAIWPCYLLLWFALCSYVLGVALCASQREGRAGDTAGRLNVLSTGTGTHSRLSCHSEWTPLRTPCLEYMSQFSVPNQLTEFFGGDGDYLCLRECRSMSILTLCC